MSVDPLDRAVRDTLHAAVDDWHPDVETAAAQLHDAINRPQHRRRRWLPSNPPSTGRRVRGRWPGWALPVATAALASAIVGVPTLLSRTSAPAPGTGSVPAAGSPGSTATPPGPHRTKHSTPLPREMEWQERTAQKLCGPGYRWLNGTGNGMVIQGLDPAYAPWTAAYLFYKAASGTACVATVKLQADRDKTWVSAFLQPEGGPRTSVTGSRTAVVRGRVPVSSMPEGGHTIGNPPGPNGCIQWGGSDGDFHTIDDPMFYSSYRNGGATGCPSQADRRHAGR